MKLDRNSNPDGTGKYALIKLRGNPTPFPCSPEGGVIINERFIDFGDEPESEFFVIRLKDKYAANALHAYAASCSTDDPEFSREVRALALRSADMSNKQKPT